MLVDFDDGANVEDRARTRPVPPLADVDPHNEKTWTSDKWTALAILERSTDAHWRKLFDHRRMHVSVVFGTTLHLVNKNEDACNDSEFVSAYVEALDGDIIEKNEGGWCGPVWSFLQKHLTPALRQNYEYMRLVVARNAAAYEYGAENVRSDEGIANLAIHSCPQMYRELPPTQLESVRYVQCGSKISNFLSSRKIP